MCVICLLFRQFDVTMLIIFSVSVFAPESVRFSPCLATSVSTPGSVYDRSALPWLPLHLAIVDIPASKTRETTACRQ